MRGWQAETQRSSVAACQPSYLYCGAHSTQTVRARVGLHITLASWANKDHLSGWGFFSERHVASQKSLAGDTLLTQERQQQNRHAHIHKKNGSQNNAWRLRALGYSLRNDKTLIIWYAELRACCAATATRDSDGLKKAERPWTSRCHFLKRKWKVLNHLSTSGVLGILPVCPPAFQACGCQLGILPGRYTGVGSEPSLPAPWLPWSGSARVLHGHLERGEHLDAA